MVLPGKVKSNVLLPSIRPHSRCLPNDSPDFVWLSADDVRQFHDSILEPNQLTGEDSSRPIESALARVENQVNYGQIEPDTLQIAATYAVVISRAHSFNDGNKRTALMSMLAFLDDHGFSLEIDDYLLAEKMEACAGGKINDDDLWNFIFEYLKEREQEDLTCESCGVEPVEHPDTSLCIGCETLQRQMDRND